MKCAHMYMTDRFDSCVILISQTEKLTCDFNDYIMLTYCHHGGIDVVSGIVGGTTSNVEVVGGVCMQ